MSLWHCSFGTNQTCLRPRLKAGAEDFHIGFIFFVGVNFSDIFSPINRLQIFSCRRAHSQIVCIFAEVRKSFTLLFLSPSPPSFTA